MDIFARMDTYASFGEDVFLDLFASMLRELLYNLIHMSKEESSPAAQVSPLIAQALTYMSEHLYTVESIEEISSALFVTETYFFRAFKEQMKISPKRYITQKRLLTAQKMIHAGKKPTEVYLLCGFRTYAAFYKRYLDFFGVAPSEDKT